MTDKPSDDAPTATVSGNPDKRTTPPYIAYQTFKTVLNNFKTQGIPPEVNKSAFPSFSGGVQSQVLLALRSLELTTPDNKPTPRLSALVDAHETERYKPLIAEALERTYPYVLALDLKTVTPSTFADSFKDNTNAKEDVLRKCRTFFLNAAKEAGIEVGPRIDNGTFARPKSSGGGKKTKKPAASNQPVVPQQPPPPSSPVVDKLLEKFPQFDPKWPDEIKKKWFDGFERFMSQATSKGGG